MSGKPKANDHGLIFEGEKVTIFSLCLADGSNPAQNFLNALSVGNQATLRTQFEKIGNIGHISNSERFKKVEGAEDVFEFKYDQVRVFCCWAGKGRMFLLFGVIKKKDKHRPADVARAEEMAVYVMKQVANK